MIQVDDGDTREEQTDDTSDVGAPLEEEAILQPLYRINEDALHRLFSKEQSPSLQEVS